MNTVIDYTPAVRALIVSAPLPPLGPGTPNADTYEELNKLKLETAFAPHAIHDRDMAACCLAGLWLLHGYLDQSHKISQDIETPSGSYWHGLMHRREPDYDNAKYWFRRVGRHPSFDALCDRVRPIVGPEAPPACQFLATQTSWDPFAFIDLCETRAEGPAAQVQICMQVQKWEWELLFDYCYFSALGHEWPKIRGAK